MIVRCKYFTGSFEGCCGAGTEYDSVKDQNRTSEPARYPCFPEMDSFTSCQYYVEDKELKNISQQVGKLVRLLNTGYSSKKQDAVLLAISYCGRYGFVEVERKHGVRKEIVGIEMIHIARK